MGVDYFRDLPREAKEDNFFYIPEGTKQIEADPCLQSMRNYATNTTVNLKLVIPAAEKIIVVKGIKGY